MKDSKREKLIPELRFPEFEGEWEEVVFSNYFKFLRSNSFSRNQLNYKCGEVLNIHYGDIHTKFSSLFFVSRERVPFINSDINLSKFKESDYLKEGDLVIADASEDYKDIGKSIEIIDLSGKKVVAGLHTIPARPGRDHALGFLGNLMKTFRVRHQIMRNANGISVLGISKTNIAKLKLTLPSPEEQQKIASFLSLIDKKIELLKKKKELLELYKKGVMQKIFNQEIRFKDKDGNDYPEWEEKRLGEIGKVVTGSTPSTKNKEYWQGDIPFITPTDINDNEKYISSSERFVKKEAIKEVLPIGGIIYTCIASIGKMGLLKERAFTNQQINALVVDKNINNEFVYYALLKKTPQIISTKANTTLSIINKSEFSSIKIRLPRAKKEQDAVVMFLSRIDSSIQLVINKSKNTKNFKSGLLQKMFI